MKFAVIVGPGEFPLWTTLGLGFVLGLRHPLDADHLAAVSTFFTQGRSLLWSSRVGLFWGPRHTAPLLVFAVAIGAFRLTITPRLSQFLEFVVGCMLVFLGINVPLNLLKEQAVHVHAHEDGGVPHTHMHVHSRDTGHAH